MLESHEPHEVYQLLRVNHLPTLGDGDLALLAARALGYSIATIAVRTFLSARALGTQLERVEDLVCVPAGVPRGAVTAGWWLGLHTGCDRYCADAVIGMIEHDTIFAVIRTSRGRAGNA